MTAQQAAYSGSILSFARLAETAPSESVLTDGLLQRVKQLGVSHVVAGVAADSRGVLKVKGNAFGRVNGGWADVYYGEKLHRHDPVLDWALQDRRGFYWSDAFRGERLHKLHKRTMAVCAEAGAKDGFLVPMPSHDGGVLIVSMQGERLDRSPDAAAFMRTLSLIYGLEGWRLANKGMQDAGELISPLPARQAQALRLAALGKPQAEIAREMGVSLNTVEYHLRMARERLGAHSTNEAVAILHAAPENMFRPQRD